MNQQIDEGLLKKSVLILLKETFEKGDGVYLDQGTSLEETLASVTSTEASQALIESGTTVAGHVDHLLFYVRVLNDYMDHKKLENIDWPGSWARTTVSESEWDSLRGRLKNDYKELLKHLDNFPDWNDEHRLAGALAVIAHSAYHLGAIRQKLSIAKE